MNFNIEVEVGQTVRLTTAGKYCDRDIMVTAKSAESAEYAEYTWNQIPTSVKNFLNNVTYDPGDYSTSQIANYAPATADVNNTYPIGITIETESGILDRNGYGMSVSSGNTTLYNDIPNQYTEYVNRNIGAVSKAGTLKPTGALRQIKCATSNVRDLGGWACDGGTVKYGMLFRGGEFQNSDLDIFVNQLGIRHELNLRGKAEEAETEPTILRDYVRFTCPEKYVWYTIGDAYKETWKEILRCVFDSVTKNDPVYFHCSAGADRTGTVACILEAILGMSQSDIDKDYELTCFSSGVSTDNAARRRNESEWSGLITQINNLSGSTFRDKVINWVATMGFTADEINAYRAAMIDGTPDTITLNTATYSVTNSLSNVETDNDVTTAAQYQPYESEITVPTGYVIENVKVTMGGTDVTASVFKGAKTNLNRAVTVNLTNCSIDGKKAVIDGQGFVSTLTANNGYTLEGGSVVVIMESAQEIVPVTIITGYKCDYNVGSTINVTTGDAYAISEETPVKCGIPYTADYYSPSATSAFRFVGYNDSGVVTETVEFKAGAIGIFTAEWTPTVATTTKMRLRGYATNLPNADLILTKGGTDVSTYYSNGKIAIPNVTGDIVITAVAVKSAASYTNLAVPNSTNTTDWSLWCNDARIGSDGLYRQQDGTCVTNYILVKPGETIYMANFVPNGNIATYASTGANVAGTAAAPGSHTLFTGYSATSNGAQITYVGTNNAYVRIAGTPTGNLEDVIITINEPL